MYIFYHDERSFSRSRVTLRRGTKMQVSGDESGKVVKYVKFQPRFGFGHVLFAQADFHGGSFKLFEDRTLRG